jgi:hypothetical protein
LQLTRNALNLMSQSYPSPQNVVDIFSGAWISRLPEVDGAAVNSGNIELFNDRRIQWANDQAGGFKGMKILELGPLEAGHSYIMSKLGAEHVLAVEANTRLYLKCLIVKQLYKLDRCDFVHGDFVRYMQETPQAFDFCLASGVLYHMTNPAELLSLVAKVSNRAMLWTQYFDQAIIRSRMSYLKRLRFRHGYETTYQGFTYTRHERRYGVRLRSLQFIGGTAAFSCWMTLEDIIAGLKYFGFKTVEIGFHDKEHVNGPAVCLACAK